LRVRRRASCGLYACHSAPPCYCDPGGQTGKLLLFSPRLCDTRTQRLQPRLDLGRRHAERLRREIGKRLFVQFNRRHAAIAEGKSQRVAHGQGFDDGQMVVRPGETMFEQVGDPAGAIDEQRSGGWFAPHFLQLLQDFPNPFAAS